MDKNQKNIILKSNTLIDCGYKLTLAEQRIINIACRRLKPIFVDKNASIDEFRIYAQTMGFPLIEISALDYMKECGVKNKNIYSELAKTVKSLYEKDIVYFDESENLVKKRWVITCKYKNNEGKISLRFHPDLVPDLLVFKGGYTQLNTAFLNKAKSFYSSRIYELLRQYLIIGKRSFELDEIRFKLGLSDSQYPKFANFKQRILTPSKEWINNNSDIFIDEISEDKCGGKSVKKLTFTIKPQHKELLSNTNSIQTVFSFNEDNSAYRKIRNLTGVNLTAEQAEIICEAAIVGLKTNDMNNVKSLDYISNKWDVVQQYGKYKDNFNPIGSLVKALRENWTSPKAIMDKNVSRFNNFEAREYDYDKLEKQLLGWD